MAVVAIDSIIGYDVIEVECNIIGFNMQTQAIGSGLQNLGNTCFFNATLQSLLYAPPLAVLFTQRTHSDNCLKRNTSEWCVFCEMQKIYNSTRQGRCFSPNNMLKNLSKIFKKFKLGRQQDSHEFLRYLIEGMQEAETGKLGKEREENDKRIRKTRIFDIFGGIIKTSVECLNCSHKSITTERYYDFNIGQECQRASSLHEGIASFFAVDKLEGSNKYLCQHCKVRSNARKRFLLESVPQVATFQLKRFTNSMRKISKFMQYPLELDLGKYLQKPRKAVMKLFAVIVHLGGSSFSGHYYAFVRQGNLWYKMDDSYVSKCSLETVTGQQAYILFYERERLEEEKNGPTQLKIVQEKLNTLKVAPGKPAQNDIHIQKIKKKEEIVTHIQKPPRKQLLTNGNSKENHKGDRSFESTKQSEEVENPLLSNIQNLLVSKLSESEVFKRMEAKNHLINDTIAKVVKQVIMEVSPKKKPEIDNDQRLSQSMDLELPGLARRRSKEQMEKQLPMAELILRTFQRILEIQAKMPPKRPHNYAQRSIYNLRKYETKMQKRRKIG